MKTKSYKTAISPTQTKSQWLIAITILAAVAGIFLRIHLLREQVLVNDEWHSMSIAITKSFFWILTHFSIPNGFTATPLNIHEWLLLHTIGWSEIWLRLPSIICGILSLLLLPFLARNIIGRRAATILAILIAISPVLIFYSRISRPYSAVACFGGLSIIYATRWMKSGRKGDGIGFAICGILAVYWHLFAAAIIATIAASVLFSKIWQQLQSKNSRENKPSWQQLLIIMSGMSIAGAILILPALINSMKNSMTEVAGQSAIHLSSILNASSLFAGTANPILIIIFWILVISGILLLWSRNKWLAGTITASFIMQITALALIRPKSCDAGIVLVRYSIILLPAFIMSAAYGLHSFLELLSRRKPLPNILNWILIISFAATLFLAGPLPRIMTQPNNFTNHGIFQDNYNPIDWSKSFCSEFAPHNIAMLTTIQTHELSDFYAFLQEHKNNRPIIEYPMLIGNHLNPYYFYQWYHQRPVIIGYTVNINDPLPLKGGGVYGNTYIDEVLNLVPDSSKLKFHNLIDMTDFSRIKNRDVEYIIFHKRFEAQFNIFAGQPQDMPKLLKQYKTKYKIEYEDEQVIVFKP